jgi:hypothetical protein
MQVTFESDEIKKIKKERFQEIQNFPDHFTDDSIQIDKNYRYEIKNFFEISGKATFENKENIIKITPSFEVSHFTFSGKTYPLEASLCIKGNHNIQLGEVKIIEHPLAVMSAYNLALDFELEYSSFPTFDYCNRIYLENLKDNLIKKERLKYFTVKQPFGIFWEKGYCILEPDSGEKEMILDHQVSYPGTTVGNWRLISKMKPIIFNYIASARTPSFRRGEEAEKFYQIGLAGGLKDYPFTLENVMLLNEDKIYNPRSNYEYSGKNYEFMSHELIDIMSWIRFPEERYGGKFCGKMTTFLFDHHKQIDMAQYFCSEEGRKNLEWE